MILIDERLSEEYRAIANRVLNETNPIEQRKLEIEALKQAVELYRLIDDEITAKQLDQYIIELEAKKDSP